MGGGPGVPQTAGRLGSEEPVDVCRDVLGRSVGPEPCRPVPPGGGPEGSDPDPAVGSIGTYFIIPGSSIGSGPYAFTGSAISPADSGIYFSIGSFRDSVSPVPFGPNSSIGPDPFAFTGSAIGPAGSGFYFSISSFRDSVGPDSFGSRPIPGSAIGSGPYAFTGSPISPADSGIYFPIGSFRDSVSPDPFGPNSSIGSGPYAFPGSPVGPTDSHPYAPVCPSRAAGAPAPRRHLPCEHIANGAVAHVGRAHG